MKTFQIYTFFFFLFASFASFAFSASLQARGVDANPLDDLVLPEGMSIVTEVVSGHNNYAIYSNVTKVASLDFEAETGLYIIHDGEGNEVSPDELMALEKRDGEIEERAVPFLVAALLGAVLRVAVKRFGKRVITWAFCIGVKYVVPCADKFSNCALNATPPWKCAAGLLCLRSAGLAGKAIGRC